MTNPTHVPLNEQDEDGSRLRRYAIGVGLIRAVLNWRCYEFIRLPRFEGLPEGAVVVAVHFAFERRVFEAVVRHPSFPPVPPGCEVPLHNGAWTLEFETFAIADLKKLSPISASR